MITEQKKDAISKKPKPLNNLQKDGSYEGQKGTYVLDLSLGSYFIKGLGSKRGLL